MALTYDQKKLVVSEVSEVAATALSAVAAQYRGITVAKMTALRNQAREKGVFLRVVKNTLAKRALKGSSFECMEEGLVGPLILAFSLEDLGSAARVLKDFAKENDKIQITMLSVGGELFGPADVDRVASLPTRDEALSKFLGTLQAPISKLAGTLNAIPEKTVRTIVAIKDAKEAA